MWLIWQETEQYGGILSVYMMEEINENTAEITEQRLLIFTYN